MAYGRNPSDEENQAERSVPRHCKPARKLYARIQKIRDELGKLLPMRSNMIFLMFCVFAGVLDPLFFYIVIIDQDNKCLQMDKKLSTIVLLLRSLSDIIYFAHFMNKIYAVVKVRRFRKVMANVAPITSNTETSKESEGNFSITKDFLAFLPVPQLLIVFTFYHMRDVGYVERTKVLNVFFFVQYPLRTYQIHQLSNKLRKNVGIWAKCLYNLFLYILISHLFGAFWYFFSIQRETSCWHSACAKHSSDPIGCMNTFYCGHRTTTTRNITFLNEHCPLDTPNGALPPFDFGIFLDSLQIHNSKHVKLEKKLVYSFWWGLRNLSNFGTNLTTSTYVWENLFAVFISVASLLLFVYLIGNIQTFVQMKATETEESRQKALKSKETDERRRWKIKKLYVIKWIHEYKFPVHIENEIMKGMEKASEKDIEGDVPKIFLTLSWEAQRDIKRSIFMSKLRTVNMLKDMDERVLMSICTYLRPVTYIENSFVFRRGDPLDCMLFIIEGTMWTYGSSDSQAGNGISSMATKPLGKDDFYGEELLDWASDRFAEVPASTKHVKTHTKVEAFVLMAKDLATIVSKYKQYWDLDNYNNPEEVKKSLTKMHSTKSNRMKKLYALKWISENEFPDDIKNDIMNSIEQALKEDKDADVHNPFLILRWQTKRFVKRYLFMDTLKTVKMLKDMDERVLTLMCDYLKPVTYSENSFAFRMGDPLDCMLFIMEGTMWTYASSDSQAGNGISSIAIKRLGKCDFYGEELIDRASDYFTELPVSSKHVKSLTKVEAFVLMAKDLEAVISRFPLQWAKKGSPEAEHIAASIIAKAMPRRRSSGDGGIDG